MIPNSTQGCSAMVFTQRSLQRRARSVPFRLLVLVVLAAACAGGRASGTASRTGGSASVADDTGRIYLESEVNRVAVARFGQDAVKYPQILRDQGFTGRVVAEFVVDARGKIEVETFTVVSSTHVEFTNAVREALYDLQYMAARVDGRPVRMRTRQAFDFKLSEYEGRRRPE